MTENKLKKEDLTSMITHAGSKEIYQVKPSDFIPFKGFITHLTRCSDGFNSARISEEEYLNQCYARSLLLTFYNFAIVGGTAVAASRLISLLK